METIIFFILLFLWMLSGLWADKLIDKAMIKSIKREYPQYKGGEHTFNCMSALSLIGGPFTFITYLILRRVWRV